MISFLEISRKCKLTMGEERSMISWELGEGRREGGISKKWWGVMLMFTIFVLMIVLWVCQFCLVKSLSRVWLFSTPWTAARQASLSITNFLSLLKLMSIELVMPFNHLILCHLLLLLPSIFPSIRVFSNESVLRIRWPKYLSFSFSISASNEYSGLISFRIDQYDLLAV